jgi:hypothetical protein
MLKLKIILKPTYAYTHVHTKFNFYKLKLLLITPIRRNPINASENLEIVYDSILF